MGSLHRTDCRVIVDGRTMQKVRRQSKCGAGNRHPNHPTFLFRKSTWSHRETPPTQCAADVPQELGLRRQKPNREMVSLKTRVPVGYIASENESSGIQRVQVH